MNARQIRFCHEYIKDLNGTQAARRAGYTGTQHSLETTASDLLRNPEVTAMVEEAKAKHNARLGFTADDIKAKLMAVAFGDPRKLVEHRRLCCRYCWGKGFGYQSTKRELENAREAHKERVAQWEQSTDPDKGKRPGKFDPLGGDGYDKKEKPHPKCPECHGEGVDDVFIHDTDSLDAEALALYAGCKHTKDGIEVVMSSQEHARALLAKHFGITKETVDHNHKVTLEQLLHRASQSEEEPKK